LIYALAEEGNLGPGRELGIAVFAHHEAKEASAVPTGDFGQLMNQAGGIQHGAGAQDSALGQAGFPGNQPGDYIAGIGDIDKDPIKAGSHDFGYIVSHLTDTVGEFIVPVEGTADGNIAYGIDNHVAVFQAGIIHYPVGSVVGHEHHGVHQVVGFSAYFLFFYITQQDFVGYTHHAQTECYMGTYMAHPNYTYNTFLYHSIASLKQKNTVLCNV